MFHGYVRQCERHWSKLFLSLFGCTAVCKHKNWIWYPETAFQFYVPGMFWETSHCTLTYWALQKYLHHLLLWITRMMYHICLDTIIIRPGKFVKMDQSKKMNTVNLHHGSLFVYGFVLTHISSSFGLLPFSFFPFNNCYYAFGCPTLCCMPHNSLFNSSRTVNVTFVSACTVMLNDYFCAYTKNPRSKKICFHFLQQCCQLILYFQTVIVLSYLLLL